MTDNLNEKNKQVKDDFMNEISKVVKKNISENSDLTEEQVIGIAIRVLRPNDQTPKYDPKNVFDSNFEGYSNYENSLHDLSHEKQKEFDDIGGPEKVNYEQMMRIYSAILNRNLFVLQIPFLTTKLSSYWVDLITPVKASLARPLVESLIHDSVVHDDSIKKYVDFELKSLHESIIIAQEDMIEIEEKNRDYKFSEKMGFPINQKILSVSLIMMAVIGTTYYWLDNRQDVFEISWLIGSVVWFVAIGFGILFVIQKTRLGYLIAGILSWVTIAFWLFDNFYVVFDLSLIAQEPNIYMTLRNFLGVMIAGIAVFSSHNVFHKIRTYQAKGKRI